jgi:hypothetical protein
MDCSKGQFNGINGKIARNTRVVLERLSVSRFWENVGSMKID